MKWDHVLTTIESLMIVSGLVFFAVLVFNVFYSTYGPSTYLYNLVTTYVGLSPSPWSPPPVPFVMNDR